MKKIIITILFSSLLLNSCSKEEEIVNKKYYKTALVQTGNIIDSESFVWYTDSFHNVFLAPKVGGKIVSISKNVWDSVSVGETIAMLDSSEAKTGYSSSNEIIWSLETLKKSTSEMFDSQIIAMEQKISQAKIGIEMADIGAKWNEVWLWDVKNTIENQLMTIDSQINGANISLETAKLQLENTINTLDIKENDMYSNSKSAITNANILWENILVFLDTLFGVSDSNKYKNDSFEIYISAKNSSIKTISENELKKVMNLFQEIKNLPTNEKNEIKIALEKYHSLFSQDMRNLLKTSFDAMENSVEWTSFPQNIIKDYKNQITNFQSQNEQIILSVSGNYFLWLKWSLDSINSFEKEKKSTLDMLQKQIELAEKQIETLKQTKKQIQSQWSGQITDIYTKTQIAQKQIELSQNSLEEASAWLEALKKQKQASLSEIDAQISQIKSGKNEAWVMIENWKVISLIDWIITKKLQEVWNVIWGGMPIFIVSSNEKIKIEIWIQEELLKKINTNDKVKIEIDWVKELQTGIITKILPTRDQITKKTPIEITLENKNNEIKLWSYSKVYFDNKDENIDSIIIPNSAIISKFMIPWVYVLEENRAKFKNIEIIKIWENFSKISGLKVWELIITEGKDNIYDWEILTK